MEIHSAVNDDKLKLFEPSVFDEESGESSPSAAELVNVQENIALKEKGNGLAKKNSSQWKLVKPIVVPRVIGPTGVGPLRDEGRRDPRRYRSKQKEDKHYFQVA
ncbi:hypothetical protein Tco_1538245 [Tanacetum coccineum]